jgi:putative endopeptidase
MFSMPLPSCGQCFKQIHLLLATQGQFWRTKSRPDYEKMHLVTDVHAPGQTRAWVPLRNMPEFVAAFEVQPGDNMYIAPENRADVW